MTKNIPMCEALQKDISYNTQALKEGNSLLRKKMKILK